MVKYMNMEIKQIFNMNKKLLQIFSPDNLIPFVMFILIVFAFHNELIEMFFKNPVAFCSIFGLTFIFYLYILFVGKKLKVKSTDASIKTKIIFFVLVIAMLIILYWPMTLLMKQII